ncbi:MAG: right-handed parallel beta-helix repeat-containing protein [Phycisphaerae bacterium]|nr:right-handed parallel beta-helix repeat-containing protein [Phycisphaerae bacterium]
MVQDRRTNTLWLMIMILGWIALPNARARVWHVSQNTLPAIASTDQVSTISEAVSKLKPGDQALVYGGIYRETVTISQSGTADQPICLEAAPGASVVLTGADRITDWTSEPGPDRIYSTVWKHAFVSWNKSHTHPNDDYHRVIGRCEQVFINGFPLQQVLAREQVTRGTFYADLQAQRLYVCPAGGQDITGRKALVEASARERILSVTGNHVTLKGLQCRYAANRAQQGAAEFKGHHLILEDCSFADTNASGAEFTGQDMTVRRCTFQDNGQLGFGANRAHRLLLTDCIVRHNNTKNFDRGWEAGGDKICMTRDAVIEHSTFVENHGNGIWFDIGNEHCEVRNCLIADNDNAGIFYEISYGLNAHDNVIAGNGFAFGPGAWGANAGISLSSSPQCVIERNLLVGNLEGFNFREQTRTTPRLDGPEGPVWNADQIIRRNVLAYNQAAQVWGWFDMSDERHWPRIMHTKPDQSGNQAKGLSLEDLRLSLTGNLYCPGPGQGLFNWGVTWKRCERYQDLATVQAQLGLTQDSRVADFPAANIAGLDMRVPASSPAMLMDCYPRGTVPGVRLGIND